MSARKRKSGLSRRALLQAGALMSAYPAPELFAQTPEPLKIGFLTVLTGPLAAGGQQQQEGAGLFLNERNGMIAGRKVELITQDTFTVVKQSSDQSTLPVVNTTCSNKSQKIHSIYI